MPSSAGWRWCTGAGVDSPARAAVARPNPWSSGRRGSIVAAAGPEHRKLIQRSLLEPDWLVPSAGRVNALVDARGLELEPAGQPWEIDIEVLDAFYQLLAALASRGMGQGRP